MRRIAVLAAMALAFAAGWLSRGCAGGATPPSATSAPAPRAVAAPPAVHRERTPSRGAAGPDAANRGADSARASPVKAADGEPTRPAVARDEPEPVSPDSGGAKPLHDVEGVVVDSTTRAPIEGVRIHFCATCDGEDLGWEGDTTDAAGKFHDHVLPDWPAGRCRFEIVAGRDGYRTARVPVTTAEVRVELEKLDRAPRPGRLLGTALGGDGKPIPGRLFVDMHDELDLHSLGVWTNADANGRFEIAGVSPGHWTVRLAESGASFETNVSEDGDATVELRGKFEDATGAFAAGELTEAAYAREKARIGHAEETALRAAKAKGLEGSALWDDPAVRDAVWSGQQLDYRWIRWAPGRDVVVTGLPAPPGAFARLEHCEGGGCEWRATVADGRAAFASVPLGRWRAVCVRPGAPDVGTDVIELVQGDGAFVIDLADALARAKLPPGRVPGLDDDPARVRTASDVAPGSR